VLGAVDAIEPGDRSGLYYSCRDRQHNTLLVHNFQLAGVGPSFPTVLHSQVLGDEMPVLRCCANCHHKRLYIVTADSAQWLACWYDATPHCTHSINHQTSINSNNTQVYRSQSRQMYTYRACQRL